MKNREQHLSDLDNFNKRVGAVDYNDGVEENIRRNPAVHRLDNTFEKK